MENVRQYPGNSTFQLLSGCFIILLLLTTGNTSIAADSLLNGTKQYGPKVVMGDGYIRSYAVTRRNGKPKSIGIEFNGHSLQGIAGPDDPPSDGKWDIYDENGNVVWYCCGTEHVLKLPANAKNTPFKHIVVNWNNKGHPPPAVYTVPHFDFHFYTISNRKRKSIVAPAAEEMCGNPAQPLSCELFDIATKPLPDEQLPPDYFSPGAVEPGMGNHLLDMFTPELNGGTFTQTWIYGTWNGKISFFEPMITMDYLQSLHGRNCFSLKSPERFAKAGYYPTQYCAIYRSGRDIYKIELNRFRWFEGKSRHYKYTSQLNEIRQSMLPAHLRKNLLMCGSGDTGIK